MYWLGSMLDVSDDVATRGQLLEAQTMYGALVEQIPAIVYQDLADESWTTAYVSPQISRILGVDPEEYVGERKVWAEMLHLTITTRRSRPSTAASPRVRPTRSSTG